MIPREPTFSADRKCPGVFAVVTPMEFVWLALGVLILVPPGFHFDFASIPRVLRLFFSVNGKHRLAALAHDYLYKNCGRVYVDFWFIDGKVISTQTPMLVEYTRKEADQIFLKLMRHDGVGKFKSFLMYNGVRSGGWVAWNNHLKNKNKNEERHDHA